QWFAAHSCGSGGLHASVGVTGSFVDSFRGKGRLLVGGDSATHRTEEILFRRACAITSVASSWQGARQEGFVARSDLVQGLELSNVENCSRASTGVAGFLAPPTLDKKLHPTNRIH